MTPFIYREFYDVPHMILTLSSPVYLLDSPFDEELDDYTEFYSVYEIKDFGKENVDDTWFDIDLNKTLVCRIKVSDVQFDATKRKEIDLNSLNERG